MTAEQKQDGGPNRSLGLVEVTSRWGLVAYYFTVNTGGSGVSADALGDYLDLDPWRTYSSDAGNAADTWTHDRGGRTEDESASVFSALIADLRARESRLVELGNAGATLELTVFGYGLTGSAFTLGAEDLALIGRLGIRLVLAISDSSR